VLEQLRPADVVDLVGLDATEVAELVAHLHPAEALDPAELVERTAGNPLLIRELVRSSGARLPARVGPVLQQSLLALPDDAQRVVSGMALAGPDVPLPLLVSVLDLPTTEVVTGIDAAVEAEVLVRRRSARSPSVMPCWPRPPRPCSTAGPTSTSGSAGRGTRSMARRRARVRRHLALAVPLVPHEEVAHRIRSVAAREVRGGDPTGAAELLELAVTAGADPDAATATRGWLLVDLAEAHSASGAIGTMAAAFEARGGRRRAGDGGGRRRSRSRGGASHLDVGGRPTPSRSAELAAAGLLRATIRSRSSSTGDSRSCASFAELSDEARRWGDGTVAMGADSATPLLATALVDRHLAR
jgi:hypothetical protein